MDLVDEQQRLLAPPAMLRRGGKDLLEVGDAGKDRRDRFESHAHRVGQQARYRRLAGPRRSPEHDRGQAAGRDHPADRAIRTGQMILADDIGQADRTQPIGQRGMVGCRDGTIIGREKICHRPGYRHALSIREPGWNAASRHVRAGG